VAVLALAGAARASDPVGIYGLVEKVVLEPSEARPERAQVWGVFRLATGAPGDEYAKPAYGYLYYSLVSGKEGDCRNEWADMKRVAGTGEVIAFANRFGAKGAVRKASEKPDKPDPHPLAGGVHKYVGTRGIAEELRSLALPQAPADGGGVDAGPVTLQAHRIADKERKGVKYVFEITSAAGDKEGSKPFELEAGKDVASWTPKMQVKADEVYTWRVLAVAPSWRGPELVSTFKGKSAR
jgi:hypothetical protein